MDLASQVYIPKNSRYLDVIFDLQNNSYKPYRKPDNLSVYKLKYLNHSPTILNELPKSIDKRILDLSSGENIFHALPINKEALEKVVLLLT